MRLQIFLLASLLSLAAGLRFDLSAAERPGSDWPKFQGPRGDGTSPETGLLRQWPAGGPKVLWRVPIEQGWNAPSVVGDDLYLAWSETPRGGAETVVCLSASSGEKRWRHSYEVGAYWERNVGWPRGGVRSTPLVSGEHLYTLGVTGLLHCIDRRSGVVVWQKDLGRRWRTGEKGYTFSPLLEDGRLILWYGDGPYEIDDKAERHFVYLQALHPLTGEAIWEFREPHREPARMGEGQTPSAAEFAGDKCVVISANCDLKAIRIADGREIWKFASVRPDGRGMTIPTPLVVDEVIVNIPDLDSPHAVAVDRSKPELPTRMLWKKDYDIFTAIHQFRHRDGYLYGFIGQVAGGTEREASDSKLQLSCLNLQTGKQMWSEPGFQAGVAIIEADGLLFVRSYQKLRLIEATSEGFRLLGEVHTHDEWKPTINLDDFIIPVLSRGRLYVRTPHELICYQVAAN